MIGTFAETEFSVRGMLSLTLQLLFNVVVIATAQWNDEVRLSHLAFLENYTSSARTLPFHGIINDASEVSLMNFFASVKGKEFLDLHEQDLEDFQKVLEMQYDRQGKCRTLKAVRGLDLEMKEFLECLCEFDQSFLHCLALGSQLLSRRQASSRSLELPLEDRKGRWLVESNTKSNDNKCIPRQRVIDGKMCIGSQCIIPVGAMLRIRVIDQLCWGIESSTTFEVETCSVCQLVPQRKCQVLCKDNIQKVEVLLLESAAVATTEVCFAFGRLEPFLHDVFGQENCFQGAHITMHMFQRKLTLKVNKANAGVQVNATIYYKYANGPDCYCALSNFACMQSCKMKLNSVIGSIAMKWDLLFSRILIQRTFNEPKLCYTQFPYAPGPCKQETMV